MTANDNLSLSEIGDNFIPVTTIKVTKNRVLDSTDQWLFELKNFVVPHLKFHQVLLQGK